MKETRGRKAKLTKLATHRLNAVQRQLVKQAAGEKDVHWADILRAAKTKVDPSTARRPLEQSYSDRHVSASWGQAV